MKADDNLIYLSDHIVKNISFPDFLEREVGARVSWSRNMKSGICNCPMPDHRDSNASFHINQMEDGAWVCHCFGCGRRGTIVSFCKDYFDLPNRLEAILWICKAFNIKNTEDLILKGIQNISKRVDTQRMAENENIRVSNLCKMLMKKSFEDNAQWVKSAYKELNAFLEKDDLDGITKIGEEASRRLKGKTNGD